MQAPGAAPPRQLGQGFRELTPELLQWLNNRGISKSTLDRNRVQMEQRYCSALKAWADHIAFPYYKDGVVVNVKYRALPKQFSQVKGGEQVFFGYDDAQVGAALAFRCAAVSFAEWATEWGGGRTCCQAGCHLLTTAPLSSNTLAHAAVRRSAGVASTHGTPLHRDQASAGEPQHDTQSACQAGPLMCGVVCAPRCLQGAEEIIIVEGELDKLAVEEALMQVEQARMQAAASSSTGQPAAQPDPAAFMTSPEGARRAVISVPAGAPSRAATTTHSLERKFKFVSGSLRRCTGSSVHVRGTVGLC